MWTLKLDFCRQGMIFMHVRVYVWAWASWWMLGRVCRMCQYVHVDGRNPHGLLGNTMPNGKLNI